METYSFTIFYRLYYLVLLLIWVYFFIYSSRHNLDAPLGFGLVILGDFASGYAINLPGNSQITYLSISIPLTISIFGILININEIRSKLTLGTGAGFYKFLSLGIISGLLLGYSTIFIPGATEYFKLNTQFTVFALLAGVIQISVAEEILSRGYFLTYLMKYGSSPVFAIALGSLLFTARHFPSNSSSWLALTNNFLVGVIGGYLTWKSKSLFPAIALHIISNLIGIIWWLAYAK